MVGQIINISGSQPVDDPEYRYRMPLVFGKIEGRGNGIKTVIPNISDVGFSLHREPAEVNKFFGCELGAQTSYAADTDRAVVNGAHTDAVLKDLIHKYVERFVLCPSCRLPETKYKIKSGTISHNCAACGAKDMVDMTHKLCTFILAQDKKAKKDKKEKEKKDRKEKKKNNDGVSDDEKKEKKKSKKKSKESSEEKKDDKKEKKKKDKKKKEKKEKEEELADAMDDLSIDSANCVDDASAMDLAVQSTKKYLLENPDASPEDLSELMINQQMASALKSHDKIHIFIRAAITPLFFKNNEFKKYGPAISKITNSKLIMERHLIASLETICVDKPKNFPVMMKQLYDEEALEEDSILDWAGEGRSEYTDESIDEDSRAALRSGAEPLVVWLQETDSEDED